MTSSELHAEALAQRLRRLPPRVAALLQRRFLEEHPLAECARFYGISQEAAAIHQARALHALAQRPFSPLPSTEEGPFANRIEGALGTPTRDPELLPLLEPAQALQRHRLDILKKLDALALEEAHSSRRKLLEKGRRLLIITLLALTAYFMWTRPKDPPPRPERRMKVPR